MRRRQVLAKLNPVNNRAPVPSGAGSGPAAVSPSPQPASREEEERLGQIWKPMADPTAAPMVRKRGRPKGSKNKR